MDKDKFLEKVRQYMKEKGIETTTLKNETADARLENLLASLNVSKNAPQEILKYKVRHRKGFFGKLKSYIERKISHLLIAILERNILAQQRFNDCAFEIIEILIEDRKKEKNS